METAIIKSEVSAPMSIKEHKEQIQTIQKLMKDVMKRHDPDKGIEGHYGTVPGCGNKMVLLKAGAEKILATFHIGVDTQVEDLSTADERRYRVKALGLAMGTGRLISTGLGECSTEEKKYKWREAVCKEEYENADEQRKQIYYKKGFKKDQIEKVMQIRTNPADMANTVLKMAKKRAIVDLCLSATACSDIFSQDLEEEKPTPPPPARSQGNPPPAPSGEQREGKTAQRPITEKQLNRLFAILTGSRSQVSKEQLDEYLWTKYQVTDPKQIEMDNYNSICDWIEGRLA